MAAALNRLGKFDEALRAGERASSLSPNSFQAYFEMAKSYAAQADYPRALEQLTHAQRRLVHEFAPLHLIRANVLIGLKNYEEAANELKLFLRIAPNDPNSLAARDALGRINAFVASGANTTAANAAR
jgi:tetratricopeptide (TPR) repeat protein